MNSNDAEAGLELLNAGFRDFIPHNKELGFAIVEASWDPSFVIARLPYDERLVGHPDSGLLHGGAITTLLDAAGGAAVYVKLGNPLPIATLDLRIDYLRPAAAGREIFSRAICYRTTRNVAFTRALAYHDTEDDPIASAAGTFMLSTKLGNVAPRGAWRCCRAPSASR